MDSVTIPSGIKTSHTWHEIGIIFRIIEDYGIECFVELGTYQGGLLTLLNFRAEYIDNFRCVSVEKDKGMIHPKVLSRLSNMIILKDCLSLTTVCPLEQDYIRRYKSIVYCDNGNKIKEAKLYATSLQSGDILLIHDYWNGGAVRDIPNYGTTLAFPEPEVYYSDIEFLDQDKTFEMLPVKLFIGTRIIGFQKI